MVCVAPPPPQVAAIIQVGPAPNYPLTFQAADPASANYLLNAGGDWDFSCFKQPIKVALSIVTSGVVFYVGGGMDSISFADTAGAAKGPPPAHQFPGGIKHVTAKSIWFNYHNDWDCGKGDGVKRCPVSSYGVYLGNGAGAFLHASDPVVQNGGNQD